jgi:hypothetical protein
MDRDHDGIDPVSQSCRLNPRLEKTFESLDRGLADWDCNLNNHRACCLHFDC